MDTATTYMGMRLKNPLVVSASPLSRHEENFRQMEDAGAAAVVMHSVFEEQLTHETRELDHYLDYGTESFAEALTYVPHTDDFAVGPDEYLENIRRAKERMDIPVIGSLNGTTVGGWIDYAGRIEEAGADGLELNVYFLPTDARMSGPEVERRYLDILRAVRRAVEIPVAIKLGPYFSSLAWMARELDDAGANGLVLFNRFYQPDIDLETQSVLPTLELSSAYEMRLPLRWVSILHGYVKASLAATTGIHSAEGVLKMLMAGADVTMLCSVLLREGIDAIGRILGEMQAWMQEFEYESVEQMKGSMSHKSCAEPAAIERANYMSVLNSFE